MAFLMLKLFLIFFVSAVVVNGFTNSYCNLTEKIFNPSKQYVTQYGKPKTITVYWDSDLTRAAASLLAVTLRCAAGYQHVRLHRTQNNSVILTTKEYNETTTYQRPFDEVRLTPFTSWRTPEDDYNITSGIKKFKCFTKSIAPINQRLHVYITESFRHYEQCRNYHTKEFYLDTAKLKDCGFDTTRSGHILHLYYTDSRKKTTAEEFALLLEAPLQQVNHTNIFEMIKNSNNSLLFVDYDMWEGNPNVRKVELNATETTNADKDVKVDCLAKEFAPNVYKIASTFVPSLKSLRSVLELENNGADIEEASCKWIGQNENEQTYIQQTINKAMENLEYDSVYYEIVVFYCGDIETTVNPFIPSLGNLLNDENLMIEFIHPYFIENCSDSVAMTEYLLNVMNAVTTSTIGVVVGGVKNHSIIKVLDSFELPVLLYDTVNVNVDLTTSIWLTNGRLLHLVLALQNFLSNNVGAEITVLSESSPTAERFNADLKNVSNFMFNSLDVPHNVSSIETTDILRKIKSKPPNIIVLNTNHGDAVTIMSLAQELNMNSDNGFTWILREWETPQVNLTVKHLRFSFCYQSDTAQSAYISQLNVNKQPPTVKASMDAVLTLAKAFRNVIDKYPQARYDLRNEKVIKHFETSFIELSPIKLSHQNLTFKNHSPEEAIVYLDEWYCGNRTNLAQLRINATARSVQLERGKLPIITQSVALKFINHYGVWNILTITIVIITLTLLLIVINKM